MISEIGYVVFLLLALPYIESGKYVRTVNINLLKQNSID